MNRRTFMQSASGVAVAALPTFREEGLSRILAAGVQTAGRSAESLAADEDYWFEIQSAFNTDRSMINFNNGTVSPSPQIVEEALRRYDEFVNLSPAHNQGVIGAQLETIRQRLAANFGCDPEEMAITRNTSESLEICQLGLDLKRGDEILTTDQDYPRMLTTWRQRERRDGIVLKTIPFDVPPRDWDELYEMFERAVTPRTRVIHFCHITFFTGQIFPVKKICQMARSRGIQTIVDGAHAFAHFPFQKDDLDCDYYGTSLHKWLLAPRGTGFLYVRKEKIPNLWPLMAAPAEMQGDIRKFEEIGTHPIPIRVAISQALTFCEGIGVERKAARLRYLRDRWARRLAENQRVKILHSSDPRQSCGIGFVSVEGLDPGKLAEFLWDKHRIIVVPMTHTKFSGLRVTPNIYSTVQEVDTFSAAVEGALKSGV
ncbi:MAG: aminotransferase class V-fold PLP-dependent enzyme [Terriglobia bacterium]